MVRLLSVPALPCFRLHHFSVTKKNTTFGTQLLVYVVTTTLVSTSRRSSLKKKSEELRFIGGLRELLQRRPFGKVITRHSGHVTYRTSVLRLNPWELAQAWYRESLLEQQLDRRCAVGLVHAG